MTSIQERKTCVAVVTTHPVQYQVPWLRALTESPGIDLKVLYGMIPNATQQGVGFSRSFEWDLPLLDGYPYKVLENRARRPALGRFFGCSTPEVGRELGGVDAVIIHGWGVRSAQQALWAARRQGIPCILRGESSALRPWPRWRRLAYGAFLRNYAAFLAIGAANRDFYARNGVPLERIFRSPYCVDNERFLIASRTLEPRRLEIRQGCGLEESSFAFLFSGKLIEKKRPFDVIDALAIARRRDPRLRLLVVGDGPLRNACETRAQDCGVAATFLGFLNQGRIAEAYVAADCLVLPSDYRETWGLVVNEAMACGRPAIVSDQVGCGPDLVVSGSTGIVYRCGDVEALAASMLEMAGQSALDRGARAREHVMAHYSIRVAVAGVVDALRFVLPTWRPV